jgi:hypothetical protein
MDREVLDDLLAHDSAPGQDAAAVGTPEEGEPAARAASPDAAPAGLAIGDIPSIPDVPDPTIRVHVAIVNQSGRELDLMSGSAKLENPKGSEFETPPPDTIDDKATGTIVVSNNIPYLTGVGGQVIYRLSDEPGTTITFEWQRGRVPNRKAIMTISPDDTKRFEKDFGFDGDNFSFTLKSKDKKPDAPGGGGALSCRVTVVNQTQQTLLLRKQDNPGGDFVTNPHPSLAPGASDNFVYGETPNSNDHKCRGTLSYDVGDPRQCAWELMWDNQKGAKNLSSSSLNPGNSPFHTLDQIDEGDENVPVVFTLSGGGGGVQPNPAQAATNCEISVNNGTQFLLKLLDAKRASGDFTSPPPKEIPPNGAATCADSGPQGCGGSLVYQIVPADGAIAGAPAGTWKLEWSNPPGASNSADSSVNPPGASLQTMTSIGVGDDKVPVSFSLFGGQSPQPPTAKPVSCTITIANQTQAVLNQITPFVESGTFQTQPPKTIAAGASAQFVFTGPADDPTKDASGGVQWSIGDTKTIAWQTSWRKPANGSSSVDNKIAPEGSGFSGAATAKDANDGTAAMTFTLTGGVQPQPEPDDEFAPPPKTKQPTLRVGDKSPDGWVEYAQRLLNKWAQSVQIEGIKKDTVNGKFDDAMKEKVKAFQSNVKCKVVDGVIGNETWSMLREGPHEAVGTDGRKPHSFEQKDAQGRFVTEKPDSTGYNASDDSYFMRIVSVGEKPIDDFTVEVMVTQPDGTNHTHHFKIGPVKFPSDDGQGNFHVLEIKSFSQRFGLQKDPRKPVDPLTCTVDAYLPKEIGGDRWTGPVVASS